MTGNYRPALVGVAGLLILLVFLWISCSQNGSDTTLNSQNGSVPSPVTSPVGSLQPIGKSSSLSFRTVLGGKDTRTSLFVEDLGNGVTIELVRIPAGSFMMGSPESEQGRDKDEGPQHKVSVGEFLMGRYEVTQLQWREVARWPKVNLDFDPDRPQFTWYYLPVVKVRWDEAKEFIARLNRKLGLTQTNGYRLPSEAEWEYAARAGTTTPFAFGRRITPEMVNYNRYDPLPPRALAKPVEVGSVGRANRWGLYDMHGNVREWCEDDWHDNYSGAPSDGRAWIDASNRGLYRVVRGGGWYYPALMCRSAHRAGATYGALNYGIGFRLVRKYR
jgi:formylglycine-generating enzyme required for sulfatase activity